MDPVKMNEARSIRVLRWLRSDLPPPLTLAFLVLLLLLSVTAPWIAPHAPSAQNLDATLQPISGAHWLGTDDLGRDILSRMIHGAPVTLYASLLAVGVAIVLGLPIGLLAGYLGGWLDEVVGRLIDTLLSFPAIVLAIAVTGALGIGLPHPPIQPVIVQITLLLAGALLAEASLSFLGLGIQPPNASWGAMLARAYQNMEIAPEQMYAPGLAILSTAIPFNTLRHTPHPPPPPPPPPPPAIAFNTLGESLRVALDPTHQRL